MPVWDRKYGSSGPASATSALYLCSFAYTKRRVGAPYDCVVSLPPKLLQACRSSRSMNFTRTFTKLGNQRISYPNLATPISKREAQIGLQPPLMELPHPRALLNRRQFTWKKSFSECVVLRMSIYGMSWMFVRLG
jgi:hypothetical protein